MRKPITSFAAGAFAATALLGLAACSGGDEGNSVVNNVGATELNVGDPAAIETIGNAAGNQGSGTGAGPAAPSNGAATRPADVPADGGADVGGDLGGNTGEAINGM